MRNPYKSGDFPHRYVKLFRGFPGSGKSFAARLYREAMESNYKVVQCSTDDFWGDPYTFIPAKLREAHLWNQNRYLNALIDIVSSNLDAYILVDNTNVSAYELKPYIKPALALGFSVGIIEPSTAWAFDVEECAKRNVHGVPVETIRSMSARWDKNVTVEQCLTALAPWEKS